MEGLKHKIKIRAAFFSMHQRCYDSNWIQYSNYGERGIIVCEEWKNNFSAFYKWAIESGFEERLQLDRIDNNGNYEPKNCRWVTRRQNCRNKTTNIPITYNGETKILIEWAEYFGIKYQTVYQRVRYSNPNNLDFELIFKKSKLITGPKPKSQQLNK